MLSYSESEINIYRKCSEPKYLFQSAHFQRILNDGYFAFQKRMNYKLGKK